MSHYHASPISGTEKAVQSVFARSMEIYGKPAAIIGNWYLAHVETPTGGASPGYDDLKPFVVCALNVLKDHQNRFEETVRTSQMLALHDRSVFVTRNTVYLLVGPGRRLQYSVAIEAFSSFFRIMGMVE